MIASLPSKAPSLIILPGLAERKAALREEMLARRAAQAARLGERAAAAIAERVLGVLQAPQEGAAVSAYWPLPGELDIRPTMAGLAEAGHALALPRVQGRGRPLIFHLWTHQDLLIDGPFRLMQPPDTLPLVLPDILLVPLVAFDRRGHRLGHGAGFYDRTLEQLRSQKPRTLALGVAFAAQEVDDVPVEVLDQPLDGVITEEAVHRCSARFADEIPGDET